MAFEDVYKGWLIKCQPQKTPNDKYLAHAVLSASTGGSQVEGPLTPNLPAFDSEKEAALAARDAARAWVDRHS
jgi:hypothetical protein